MKLEDTFLHIPKEAIRASSAKIRYFWVLCVVIFSFYVSYTSVDIVNTYFKQKIVVKVDHDRFTVLPDMIVEVLPTWDPHFDISNDSQALLFKRTLFSKLQQHGYGPYKFKKTDPVTARDYLRFVRQDVGFVTMYMFEVDRQGSLPPLKTAFTERFGSPMYQFVISLNKTNLNDDFARIQIGMLVGCTWRERVRSVGSTLHQISVRVFGDEVRHHARFGDRNWKQKLRFKATRLVRLQNCVSNRTDHQLENNVCLVKKTEEVYNCCLCASGLLEHCYELSRCCEHSDYDGRLDRIVENACAERKPSVRKPLCDRLVSSWTTETDYDLLGYVSSEEQNLFCASRNYEYLTLEILVDRDYICYKEVYSITVANMFSSIGGVLGFFLGGSIISVIQCFVIGYRQLVVAVKKSKKLPRRWKLHSSRVQIVSTRWTSSKQ